MQQSSQPLFEPIADCIVSTITRTIGSPDLQTPLLQLMALPGRVLSPQGNAKWPYFVLEPCRVFGGNMAAAVYAAAAVEFLVGMADVVDDLVDEDAALLGDNWKQHVNAAPPLAFLALACVHELRAWLPPERVLAIEACVLRQMLTGHAGESRDLQLEQLAFASEDEIHQMMLQKAGALVAMACQMGTLLATDDAVVLEQIGTFGLHTGMVAQLLNDMSDIDPLRARPGSDIQRRKKTLPIAYALRCAQDEQDTFLLDWANGNGSISAEQEVAIASRIRDMGGLHYAWVIAEAHQNEALRALQTLARVTQQPKIYALQRLIPPLRSQQRVVQ